MASLLEVNQLTKIYNGQAAVNAVSFAVTEGSCLGLLGPNGAGKTTTVELMEGIKRADSGSVLYRGHALDDNFRSRAGIMFQSTALQDYITVNESLELFAQFYPQQINLQQLIDDCSLGEFLHQDTSKLSGGQRQRLLLAIALVNDPDIIFLDEPTTGLDPQARRNFWQLIHRIKQQNKTIVLTTHYMEEAYELCDEIIIMDHGEIIAEGSPRALLAGHFNDVIIQLPQGPEIEAVIKADREMLVRGINYSSDVFEIRSADISATIQQLVQAKVPLHGLQVRERTLEDLFLELTGEALRQ